MDRTLVTGFFHRGNLGDDAFEYMFKELLPGARCVSVDDLLDTDFIGINRLIIGGGDLLNDYFLVKIGNLIKKMNFQGLVLAFSVGCPDPKITRHVDFIDYFTVRNATNVSELTNRFGSDYVRYTPDLVFALKLAEPLKRPRVPIFAICLAQPVVRTLPASFISDMTFVIDEFATRFERQYSPVLYAFNTNRKNIVECDFICNDVIYDRSLTCHVSRGFNGPMDAQAQFACFGIAICMRFHSVVFAIMNKVPFIACFKQQKIRFLLQERELDVLFDGAMCYDLSETPFYRQTMLQKLNLVHQHRDAIRERLAYSFRSEVHQQLTWILSQTTSRQKFYQSAGENAKKCDDFITRIMPVLKQRGDPEFAGRMASFFFLRRAISDYTYGLSEKILKPDFKAKDNFKWLLENSTPFNLPNQDRAFANITFIDQNDYDKVHRSGWQYVYESLYDNHSEHAPLLDMAVERTFIWNRDYFSLAGITPYKKPWVGFIHHTFYDKVQNNLHVLLAEPLFIESLKTCKALVVMSEYLAQQLRDRLPGTRVSVVTHPTELHVPKWEKKKYLSNDKKRIVHVGYWLRDVNFFHTVHVPFRFTKTFLKAKFGDTVSRISHGGLCSGELCGVGGVSRDPFNIESLHALTLTSDILDTLDNDQYDELLTKNIVMIKLLDASAVNTVIECLARGTPIMINPHPAVVEVLSDKYPLYYESEQDILHKLKDDTLVLEAHRFLKSMEKTKLDIKTFERDLRKIMTTDEQQ